MTTEQDAVKKEHAMERSYGERYRDLYQRHWWWRARENYVLREITRRIHAPARILDVGCGDGLMWDRLADLGEVEGIEPDGGLVTPDAPWSPRIEVAPFLEGRERPVPYDLVLMLDVLEHIEDEHAALQRVHSLLKPGAHLILTVPALMTLWSEFDVINGHFRRYTKKTLRAAFVKAGFEILELRYYYLWSVLPLLLRRLRFRAQSSETSSFVAIPASPINSILREYSILEHRLSRVLPFPLGSSLIAVVRRP